MSRKFALLAAAFAFTAIIGAGSVAHAQAQSDMIPPGAPLPGGSTARGPVESGNLAPAGRTAYSGSGAAASTTTARPYRHMRGNRQAMRRDMRQRRAAATAPSDRAYLGGGAVYERGADGSLRPVM
jgi:hypothetical protein